jgi:hypothetical protein
MVLGLKLKSIADFLPVAILEFPQLLRQESTCYNLWSWRASRHLDPNAGEEPDKASGLLQEGEIRRRLF